MICIFEPFAASFFWVHWVFRENSLIYKPENYNFKMILDLQKLYKNSWPTILQTRISGCIYIHVVNKLSNGENQEVG